MSIRLPVNVLCDSSDSANDSAPEPEHIRLSPCRNNLLEWHFTIAGPPDTAFEGGLYHGRVLLPLDYPASAPRIQMMTPSGRFEVSPPTRQEGHRRARLGVTSSGRARWLIPQVGRDICLSASAFHQETWQPAWTVRTLVQALRPHMATKVRPWLHHS
jgi:ubiquitin-conjugating enzyme E2 J1